MSNTNTVYLLARLYHLVIGVTVYDALLDTNDGNDVRIAETGYGYDDYAAMGGMENYGGTASPPGHDGSGTGVTVRGNVTGRIEHADLNLGTTITWLMKYDIFGNVTQQQLACCRQQTDTYGSNTYYSQRDASAKGDPAGPTLTTTLTYDFNTGLWKIQEDPNSLQTTQGYDAALQPSNTTGPTGASRSTGHNHALQQVTSTVNYEEGGSGRSVTTTTTYDGWERPTQTVSGGGQVNTAYDNMGRVQSRTNPFTPGGTPGPATTYTYDALGRLTTTTLPGGNTVQNSYSGNTVTVTDQVNRKLKREADGLGRLVKVTEQDATGALTQETTYTYDLRDNLTGVNQGNQTRAYKYDALRRLTYERIPEQSATLNDGTGTFWTTKYVYNNFGAVSIRTDARGVETHYKYDGLNRLIEVWYTGLGGDEAGTIRPPLPAGVAATNSVFYTYSTTGTTKGMLASISMTGPLATYTETFSYDGYNRVQSRTWSRDGRSYTVGYQYNTASQITRLTYPSTRQVNYNHDYDGRLSSLTEPYAGSPVPTYLSNLTYNPAGQMTGATLGNNVVETYGYDSNRLQPTSQTATRSGNTLMNLTYNYNATAGQMGPGTTAGNAGQLMSVSGSINGTTESAAYTYDLWGRVATSSQTTNGVSAQRRFAYDRWGNRTAVWDAVSGGNQIQSVALQQSGGAPTNRIQSVTSGGTFNYTYDAAGNVTHDGSHSYEYDAENRLKSVDNTATAAYAYDYANRRIKRVVGSAQTHYVWEGNQVIAEYNSATGAQLLDYVYAGNRLLAKGAGSGIAVNPPTYLLSDRLSVRLVVDGFGAVVGRQGHLPFGEELGVSGTPDKHRFTSYERDGETGGIMR